MSTETEQLKRTLTAVGGNIDDLPDNLKSTIYKAIILKLGGMVDDLSGSETEYLKRIAGCIYGGEQTPLKKLFNFTRRTSHIFSELKELTTIPDGLIKYEYTSNVTNMASMFYNCNALTEVPLFDTSNVTNMYCMFQMCGALTEVPLFDTSNVTNMSFMFHACSSLTEVPSFDMRNVTNAANMFYNCRSLTSCWVKNIKYNLQVGSGTSYGHLLTVESLVHLIYQLRDMGAARTLTVGGANLAKLANVYVRTIDITDEMRAEDDLIDEKLPFEVCESTDEGACLIRDYAGLKNWVIQ